MHSVPVILKRTDWTHRESLTLRGGGWSLDAESPLPLFPLSSGGQFGAHEKHPPAPESLAGIAGQTARSVYRGAERPYEHQHWLSTEGDLHALRWVIPTPPADLPLGSGRMLVLGAYGSPGLRCGAIPAAHWTVLRQGRHKNDLPGAVRLGQFDDDYAQAVHANAEVGGLIASAEEPCAVEADPFLILTAPGAPALLIGFLDLTLALTNLTISTTSDRTAFAALEAWVDEVPPPPTTGESHVTPWLLVMEGKDPAALMKRYAELVARHHALVPPPRPAPSVFCTWYYWGPTYAEAAFTADAAWLEETRLPYDVFLLDDGWADVWGDWVPGRNFPQGMSVVADRIRTLRLRPGIWTCPFLVRPLSQLARTQPDWLLRAADGTAIRFLMLGENLVLDPTHPGVLGWLRDLFGRLTREWRFTYHKLDFTRAVLASGAVFHDRNSNRLTAYRTGLAAIREAIGPDSYLSVCGGHYGGSLGLADSQRSGSDVASCWDQPPILPKLRQNFLRTWMGRLWHVDADALMVRRRATPAFAHPRGELSLGRFTDEEARSLALNQYLAGQLVCFSERLPEIATRDADRLALHRHVMPPLGVPARPLDPLAPGCPSRLLTHVPSPVESLADWRTVALFNFSDHRRDLSLALADAFPPDLGSAPDQILVFEFFTQTMLGVFACGQALNLRDVPPHAPRLLRLAPWTGDRAVLAGTDLHFSGGGVELAAWSASAHSTRGRIETRWPGPVRVTIAFPAAGGPAVNTVMVTPGQPFELNVPPSVL